MGRSEQKATYNQTKGESQQSFGDAENAYKLAQDSIGDYKTQLGRYAADNPFTRGGEFQNSENQIIANSSDAAARSAGTYLQAEAARTGQNPAGVIGATRAMEQQGARDIAAQQSQADRERIGKEAEYNQSVLGATAVPVSMEEGIGSGEGNLYGHALGVQEQAAATPGFLDTLEAQLAQAGTAFAGGLGKGLGESKGKG